MEGFRVQGLEVYLCLEFGAWVFCLALGCRIPVTPATYSFMGWLYLSAI